MIKISFLGDILCDYSMAIHKQNYLDSAGRPDYLSVFSHLQPLLRQSDYVIANLESPISADGCNLTSAPSNFNSPLAFAEAVKACGIDLVTTANNHCLDRGIEGLRSTLKSLGLVGLKECGLQDSDEKRYRIETIGSARIGILTYTYGTNACYNQYYLPLKKQKSVNLLQEQEGLTKVIWQRLFRGRLTRLYNTLERILFPANASKAPHEKETLSAYRKWLIRKDFRALNRQKPDLILACLHIGGQLNREPSAYTQKMSDWFLHHGADLVICNHEHVIHGTAIDKDGKGFVAYALGDCLSGVGLHYGPFDRLADHSIALHLYYDDQHRKMKRISFSVLKRIIGENGRIEIWPAADLLRSGSPKEDRESFLLAAALFTGKRDDCAAPEINLYEYGETDEKYLFT